MKKLLLLLTLMMSSVIVASDDLQIKEILTSYLGFGTYIGQTYNGNKCVVIVSENEVAPQQRIKSLYQVEIFSAQANGWYAFSTNTMMGGRGDCAEFRYQTPTRMMIKNNGPNSPCLSHPTRSNAKGLDVETPNNGLIQIRTFDAKLTKEASCLISIL